MDHGMIFQNQDTDVWAGTGCKMSDDVDYEVVAFGVCAKSTSITGIMAAVNLCSMTRHLSGTPKLDTIMYYEFDTTGRYKRPIGLPV